MADSTLAAIQTKVRRLTRTPSTAQLPDADLNQYINTFVLYDMPEHLRLFNLHRTFTFYCEPYIDRYKTDTIDPSSTFYNFKNKYITLQPPVYVAGFQSQFLESREQFYAIYPALNDIFQIGQGNGIITTFTGILTNVPVIRDKVLFSSVATDDTGLALYDDGLGNLIGNGTGTINYVTGAYNFTYSSPPGPTTAVNSMTVPYVAAIPQALLFFNGEITLRPIPDQPYRINIEAFVQPTELLATSQDPDLNEWWQYIAYGASKKIFEDRMDQDSVQMILPEFLMQQDLVQRRTIVQQTSQRTSSIYSDQTSLNASGNGYWGWGFGQF
jgi:hypothetical protein